jgi:hypothetical protein
MGRVAVCVNQTCTQHVYRYALPFDKHTRSIALRESVRSWDSLLPVAL